MPHRHAVDELLLAERQRAKRFREQLYRLDADRRFARARAKQRPAHSDDIIDVEQVEGGVGLVAELVLLEIELDPTRVVGQMCERRLAVRAPGDESARNAHGLGLGMFTRRRQRHGVRRPVRARVAVGERGHAPLGERLELLASRPLDEVQRVGHAAALPEPPVCVRYVSMNGSMSPSMTRCTSGILSSVRWSFTIVYGWKT